MKYKVYIYLKNKQSKRFAASLQVLFDIGSLKIHTL